VLTWPNLITLVRLLLVAPMVVAGLGGQDRLLVGLIALSYFLDLLDGHLARLLDQCSRFGAQFDKLVDAVSIVAVLAAWAIRGLVPLWLIGLLVVKDLIQTTLAVVLLRRGRAYPQVYLVPRVLGFGAPIVATLLGSAYAPWAWLRSGCQGCAALLFVASTTLLLLAAARHGAQAQGGP